MKTGEIVLIPFPFSDFVNRKVRPAVVISETKDIYKDAILCAISSVVPITLNQNEILLLPSIKNGLRKNSILKVDRIVTAKANDIIATIGLLSQQDIALFKMKFKQLVD